MKPRIVLPLLAALALVGLGVATWQRARDLDVSEVVPGLDGRPGEFDELAGLHRGGGSCRRWGAGPTTREDLQPVAAALAAQGLATADLHSVAVLWSLEADEGHSATVPAEIVGLAASRAPLMGSLAIRAEPAEAEQMFQAWIEENTAIAERTRAATSQADLDALRAVWEAHPEAFTVGVYGEMRGLVHAETTLARMDRVAAALTERGESTGAFPDDLAALGVAEADLRDAWGGALVYAQEAGTATVTSMGEDQAPGGAAFGEDLVRTVTLPDLPPETSLESQDEASGDAAQEPPPLR